MKDKAVVISSLLYKFAERVSVKLITFVISIILARLLEPATFGMLAILTVFVNLCQTFVQSGMNVALIQTPNIEKKDYSTIFWVSLIISIILYIVLFITAPLIAQYYDSKMLILPLRVLAVSLCFGAFNSVQTAQMSREMKFKHQFICNLITVLISGIIGIGLAYMGYGLWALVIYYLMSQIVLCIAMLFTVKWYPRFEFSLKRAVTLLNYGWKILISNLLYSFYTDVRALIIAKVYSTESLAYYDRGNQLPNIVCYNLDIAIQAVMLPTLSRCQDDYVVVRSLLKRMIKVSTYVITPIMIGIAAISKEFTLVVLSDKWLDCVIYMIVFSLGYVFLPISSSCNVAIKAIGKADVFMKNQVLRISVMFATLLVSVFCFSSVLAIAVGYSLSLFFEMIIAIWPVNKYLNYSYQEVFKDILPNIIISAIMGIVVFLVGRIEIVTILVLLIQICIGVIAYTFLSICTRNDSFYYILNHIMQKKDNR